MAITKEIPEISVCDVHHATKSYDHDDEAIEKWNVSINSMYESLSKSRGMYPPSSDLL